MSMTANVVGVRRRHDAARLTKLPSFAVLGAGHGGMAMAADLAIRGFTVNLYNKSPERIQPVRSAGGITLGGAVQGFGVLNQATSDIAAAVKGVDVVMVAVPATGHRLLARLCAPHLTDGQMVVLNPGRTMGAVEFLNTLRQWGCNANVVVAEAQTFIYASRALGPAEARIYGYKRRVPVAAVPEYRTPELLAKLREAFPQFAAAPSVLKTSLDNMGAILHPALTLLNAGRIEQTQGDFDYYHEGVTPAVARVLEAMDAERCAVARRLGVEPLTVVQWLGEAYGAHGEDLVAAIQANPGYAGIKAPATLDHRYITEDVPMSLVPIATLGELVGVETPTIRSIIHMANLVHGVDYWEIGRNARRLGITGYTAEMIRELVSEGVVLTCASD